MTETISHNVPDVDIKLEEPIPQEIYDQILGRLATQPGIISIDEPTLTAAIRAGMQYGETLVNGFKPQQNIVENMARDICGLNEKPPRSIADEPFLLVTLTLDRAARIAKARRHEEHHV